MRKYISKLWIVTLMIPVLFYSCDLEEEGPAGASDKPVITEIVPAAAGPEETLTIKGSGLGDIHSVVFELGEVTTKINSTFNTDGALVFRVPVEALQGVQKINFVNGKGIKFSVDFEVLGFALVSEVSNYNFSEGDEITLTGINMGTVETVTISGTEDEATIVSSTATTVTIAMPASEVTEGTLRIENEAGSKETDIVFVNRAQAFVLFDDTYGTNPNGGEGFYNGSWGGESDITTGEVRSGTSSIYKTYCPCWHLMLLGNNNAVLNDGYKYLTFWIKGADQDYNMWINSNMNVDGMQGDADGNMITVPANVWTYYKVPVANLDIWENGDWTQMGFFTNDNDADATFHFDDIMFVK